MNYVSKQRDLERREARAYALVRLWLQGKDSVIIVGTKKDADETVARAKVILERMLTYGEA